MENTLVRNYLRAAVRLYGAIRLWELYSIFTQHNGAAVTAEEFFRQVRTAEVPDEPYRIIGEDDIYRRDITVPDMERWLVHRQYCYATWDALFTLECNQEGKPVRLLPKEQMLRYADPAYIPHTPQIRSLEQVLREYSEGKVSLSQILAQAVELAEDDCDAPDFLKQMQHLGCRFPTKEDRLRVAKCYKGVYDTVPKPIHKGHTELEMRIGGSPIKRHFLWYCPPLEGDSFHLGSPRLTEDAPFTGQTDRRGLLARCMQSRQLPPRLEEPCCCGSGLRYADCCGKR